MNKAEYAAYEEAVEHALGDLTGVSSGHNKKCDECKYCSETDTFCSKELCDLCQSESGNRTPAHGISKEFGLIHFEICDDCVYYLDHGVLDDMQMMEMENE